MQRSSYVSSSADQSDKNLWSANPTRSDSSDSEETSHDNLSSPCLSYVSKYSSDSTTHTYDSRSQIRTNQATRELNNTHPRSNAHGQAEQIRRSRESITFALIDAQLSMPPLSQVRDMYLQTRSGCGTSTSNARTTKKANLSVVHTVVRFRIKEYLLELREHIRRSLDTLFYNLVQGYDVKSRDTLASKILGLSSLPCSSSCEFCPDLMPKSERLRLHKHDHSRLNPHSTHLGEQLPSTSCRSPIPLPIRLQTSMPTPSIDATRPQSPPSNSPVSHVGSEGKIRLESPKPTEFDADDTTDNTLFNSRLSEYSFPELSAVLERPLPSYHINSLDYHSSKRVRLDSTPLRLSSGSDNIDWAAEDIDFGVCEEELVDLHSLVFDSSSDAPSKIDETFFDPAYDAGDLMHHFTMDKHPGLQLTISP
ncbi:unnamed protein product [Heterobilharzia americana]|nr:unnamed protein product [Heterobilharzia americana]